MDRITRRDEYNELECIVESVECNGYCNGCDVHTIIERLAKYEDEDGRRDDGCDMCKDIAPDVPGVCRMDTLYMVYYDYAGESHDLSAEPPNYCPFCGRKLVE